jgi:hypothetical protein
VQEGKGGAAEFPPLKPPFRRASKKSATPLFCGGYQQAVISKLSKFRNF